MLSAAACRIKGIKLAVFVGRGSCSRTQSCWEGSSHSECPLQSKLVIIILASIEKPHFFERPGKHDNRVKILRKLSVT